MDWYNHFEDVFFTTWINAGLPHFQKYIGEYVDIREHGKYPSNWIRSSKDILPNINGDQLYSVYGFGVVIGKIIAEMLGIEKKQVIHSSDWCGRFNLGISLFDHICDVHGGLERLSELPVVAKLLGISRRKTKKLNPSEALLEKLANGVLKDIEKFDLDNMNLLSDMRMMFEAESLVASTDISANPNPKTLETSLFNKSVLPFIVMAEYTAISGGIEDPIQLGQVKELGEALGSLYWLIDDAKDVWDDLKAGHWNLFLLQAATREPLLFSLPHKDIHTRLLGIWQEDDRLKAICIEKINRLVYALKSFNLQNHTEKEMLGLIAASLWQWWKF